MTTGEALLITGATGFLGGVIARRALAAGWRVRVLARSAQKAATLADAGAEVVLGDLTDAESRARAVAGCDVVVHAGASFGSRAEQTRVNVEGTATLVQAAADADVRRFVHISTISVYGFAYNRDVTEADAPAPGIDAYAVTKTAAERRVVALSTRAGLPYTILRPGMIYGAGSSNWTEALFRWARLRPTPFFGDGRGACFPIHVDDVADLTLRAAQNPAAIGEVFHATPDPSPTWRDFLGGYARLAGHESWLALPFVAAPIAAGIAQLIAPADSALRELPDAVQVFRRHTTYRMDKARDLLGWEAAIPLDLGIASCGEWLRGRGLLA